MVFYLRLHELEDHVVSIYERSLVMSSIVIVICIRIKCVLLDTELTTIVTVSKLVDFECFITKFMLIVSYLVSSIGRE